MTLDGDLQHPPAVIPLMIEQMRTCNSQVVYGIRKNLDVERFSKRLSTRMFFLIVRYVYGIRLEPYANDFRLISRDVFEQVLDVDSARPTLRAILPQLQLATSLVEFDLRPRLNGESKFTVRKMAALFLDTVTYAPRKRLTAFSSGILVLLSIWVLLFSFSISQMPLLLALLPFQVPHVRGIYKKLFEN
jgi:dolichol-phosphate mannosyltransferase